MYPDDTTKRCAKCTELKPFSQFNKRKRSRDGLYEWCKACVKVHSLKYRAENYDVVRARERARDSNRSRREWYRERNKKYYADPIKGSRIRMRARLERQRRRSREQQNGGSYTIEQWNTLCASYDHRCLCCGKQKPLTADHVIPLTLGGSNDISNIQPLCQSCNSAKGNRRTTDYRPTLPPWMESGD